MAAGWAGALSKTCKKKRPGGVLGGKCAGRLLSSAVAWWLRVDSWRQHRRIRKNVGFEGRLRSYSRLRLAFKVRLTGLAGNAETHED